MKTIFFLFVLLVLSANIFAQNKISKEEKAARYAWVQKQMKNIPLDGQQKDIITFYNSLPNSTLDSLFRFQNNPDFIGDNSKSDPYQFIPIPPSQGKEKIIPIPLQDPSAKFIEIKR